MSALMAEWRAKKAREEEDLHLLLRDAIVQKRVEIYTDQRMLDFQGSPIHNTWDHLAPLLTLMCLALAILLATGVAIGIVAMTLGALGHLLGIKHFVAWRIRIRAKRYMMESVAHMNHLWHLGGIAIVVTDSSEPPCVAPRGDWRKFVRRALGGEGQSTPTPTPAPEAEDDGGAGNVEIVPP